jgi:Thioredoxin like C-terminal domain
MAIAADVHFVMRQRERGTSVPFRVLVDGEPPGDGHGLDVGEQGHGALVQPRLYQLIRQWGSITDRTFEITFRPSASGLVFPFGSAAYPTSSADRYEQPDEPHRMTRGG